MLLDLAFLDKLSFEAKRDVRLRRNYNLHDSLDAPSQRLFNALQPGTKMEIHRHCNTSETCIVIRGSVKYTLFTNDGGILDTFVLKANSECFGYNVPAGQWHTLEPLETETIIFGCKDGPYHPLSQQDILKVTKIK